MIKFPKTLKMKIKDNSEQIPNYLILQFTNKYFESVLVIYEIVSQKSYTKSVKYFCVGIEHIPSFVIIKRATLGSCDYTYKCLSHYPNATFYDSNKHTLFKLNYNLIYDFDFCTLKEVSLFSSQKLNIPNYWLK